MLVLLIYSSSFADCSFGFSEVFPKDTLSKKGYFILEGGYYATSLFKNDGVNHLYFVNKNDTVKALLQNVYKDGLMGQQQSLLKAEKDLLGGRYMLMVINDSIRELYRRFNRQSSIMEPLEWVINHTEDSISPVFETSPAFLKQTHTWMGCGPIRNTYFEYTNSAETYYFIEIHVRTKSSKKWQILYVKELYNSSLVHEEKKVFSIGHGMCYGAFGYRNGIAFEAKFRLMDLNGNVSEFFSPIVEFVTPTPENSAHFRKRLDLDKLKELEILLGEH